MLINNRKGLLSDIEMRQLKLYTDKEVISWLRIKPQGNFGASHNVSVVFANVQPKQNLTDQILHIYF